MKNQNNQKMLFRMLSCALALLMLLGMMVACAGNQDPSGDSESTEPVTGESSIASSETDPPETTELEKLFSDLPTDDYGQYEFHILNNKSGWAITVLSAEGETGESINDAIYQRNQAVEKKLNIRIVVDEGSFNTATVRNQAAAQDPDGYDCFFGDIGASAQLAVEGILLDFNTCDDINMEKPWWYEGTNRHLNIGESTYMLVSDIHLHYHEGFYMTAFSQPMVEELHLDNPYDLVKNNTWTIDKMAEMVESAAHDLNGDTVIDATADRFGLAAHYNIGYSALIALNASPLTTDSCGAPYYGGAGEHFVNAYQKIVRYFYNNTLAYMPGNSKIQNAGSTNQNAVFTDGRALFLVEVVGTLKQHRNDSNGYGIVVMPKYDENQEEYFSPITNSPATLCSWKYTKDTGRLGTILENLAAESYKYLKPAYYELTLYYKYSKDETSIEMLDLVYLNGRFEIAFVYDFGGIRSTLETCMRSGTEDIASTLNQYKNTVNRAIKKTLDAYGVEHD